MGEDEDDRQFHQGTQANCRLHVVGEDKEARAEGADLRQGQPVQDRAHGVFAHAEMHVARPRAIGFDITGALEGQPSLGRWREIRRTADEPGITRRDGVQHLRRGIAAGDALGVGGKARQFDIPVVRQRATLDPLEAIGKLGVFLAIFGEPSEPVGAKPAAARADASVKMSADAIRHQKLCVLRPAIEPFGQADLLLAEGLAMRGAGVVLVRRSIADMTVDDDQGRHLPGVAERRDLPG